MGVWGFRERIALEGVMPERALLRLKRAGIAVYNVKKPQKNRLLFSVNKKDSEKVFAIYPDMCYNKNVYSPFFVKRAGAEGLLSLVRRLKNRIGILVGALAFCACTTYFDGWVFGVEYVGTDVYAREAAIVLEEYGVKPFSRYAGGNEDIVCAKLLALDGVEFCSVQKRGLKVRVEMRLSSFPKHTLQSGDMTAERSGRLVALTVLRGTALKAVGDEVTAGEALVGGYFQAESGERSEVAPVARARIACTYEESLEASSAEEAFAKAYLALGLGEKDEIVRSETAPEGNTFHVKIEYETVVSRNF